MNGTDDKFRSRKWLIANKLIDHSTKLYLLLVVLISGLLYFDKMGSETWENFLVSWGWIWFAVIGLAAAGYGLANVKMAQIHKGGSDVDITPT